LNSEGRSVIVRVEKEIEEEVRESAKEMNVPQSLLRNAALRVGLNVIRTLYTSIPEKQRSVDTLLKICTQTVRIEPVKQGEKGRSVYIKIEV